MFFYFLELKFNLNLTKLKLNSYQGPVTSSQGGDTHHVDITVDGLLGHLNNQLTSSAGPNKLSLPIPSTDY